MSNKENTYTQDSNLNSTTVNGLQVLHKSNNFIVINKQYDVVINKTKDCTLDQSVQDQLSTSHPNLVNHKLKHGFHFVHRLDYSTSGILCIALSKQAAASVQKVFKSTNCRKYYLALVRGHPPEPQFEIMFGVGADGRQGMRHKMCTSDKPYCLKPRNALTKCLVLQRGTYDNQPVTKLLIRTITGRRHQIRVHLESVGLAIVGDMTYSNDRDPNRMYLHAFRLVMPCDIEGMDVSTIDPFCANDRLWVPTETVNELSDLAYEKLE